MSASSTPRSEALRAIATRAAIIPDVPAMRPDPKPTSSYFGSHTFGAKQMRDKLPKDVHQKLTEAVRLGKKLDAEIAIDAAAAALGVDDLSAFTREVAGPDVSKAAIERAVKARGRKVAPTMNEILETVRSKGGARREVKETIGIFTKEAPAP